MATKLESLIVDLQLENAELKKSIDESNAKLDSLGDKLNELAGVVVFEKMAKMAFEASKALGEFALKGAESADAMGKAAQATGTTVENFSRLAYAGQLAGVDVSALSAAMVKLNKSMAEAASGTGQQAALFNSLGVKVTDTAGQLRTADAVLADVAARFANMEDGAKKTTIATELFGKSGAQLIPMLNAGRDGLAELAAEADRLGITITGSAAASAEAFLDNITKLEMAFKAIGQRAAAELTPALSKLTNELLTSKSGAQTLETAGKALALALKSIVSAGVVVGAVFETIGKVIARVASAIANVVSGRFKAAFEDVANLVTLSDAVGPAQEAVDRLKTIWDDSGAAVENAAKRHKNASDQIIKSTKAVTKLVSGAAVRSGTIYTQPFLDAAGGAHGPRHPLSGTGGADKAIAERDATAARWRAETAESNVQIVDWFDRMSGMLASAGTQMLGAVGDLVSSIAQGAQQGGVWGAIIAAFMEVAKKTESALAFLDTAMQFIEKIAAMVEPLVAPIFKALEGVLEIVADVMEPVFKALQPFFDAIGSVIQDLEPILFAIGDLFAALSPVIEFVGRFIKLVFDSLKPVFDLVGGVVKVIATVILGVLIALNEIAAAFGDQKAKAEAARMRGLVDSMWTDRDKAKTDFQPRGDEGAGGATPESTDLTFEEVWRRNEERAAKIEAARYTAFSDAIASGLGYDAAIEAGEKAKQVWIDANPLEPIGELATAADDAAKAIASFSGSLLNVPAGFRYAAAAFNAQGLGDDRVFDQSDEPVNITLLLDGEVIAANLERRQRRNRANNPTGNYR